MDGILYYMQAVYLAWCIQGRWGHIEHFSRGMSDCRRQCEVDDSPRVLSSGTEKVGSRIGVDGWMACSFYKRRLAA